MQAGQEVKPRIRRFAMDRWECGVLAQFFDAGWVYVGMSDVRGVGHSPAEAFKQWQRKTEVAADSAAQS